MLDHSYHRRVLGCLALVTLVLLPAMPLAVAGEAGKGVDPAKAAALAHFETAKRLYDVREYGKALEEYKAAYVAKPDPAFLFNIAQCHRKLGQNEQALDFFQQFLKKSPADAPNRSQVAARIADLQAEAQAKADQAPPAKPELAPLPSAPTPLPAPAPPLPPVAAPLPAPLPAGTDLSPFVQETPAAEAKPIYGTWWFWTGVGAVVVAGAATTAYLLSSKGGTSIPATPMGNRPVFP